MGIFLTILKVKIGWDTGKALSSILYGDKHATVYRRVSDSTTDRKRETMDEMQERIKREHIKTELDALDNEIRQKTESLLDKEIPQDVENLTSYLINLSAKLHTHGWKFGYNDENEILNKYPDTLLLKFKQSLFLLESNFPHCDKISTLKQQLKKYCNTRFIKKNIIVMGIGLFFIILIISILI